MGNHAAANDSTPPTGTLAAAEKKVSGILAGLAPTPPVAPEPTPPKHDGDAPPAALEDDLMLDESEVGDDGDDGDGEDETPPKSEDEQPDQYEVKIDGETVKVTLEEALKGYSRQADYTRKTTAVAKEREEVAKLQAEIREVRAQYADRLAKLDNGLKSMEPQEPDWDAVQRDRPEEYAALYADWGRTKEKRDALQAERMRVQEEEQQEQDAALTKYVVAEQAKLHTALPALKDPEKGVVLSEAIVQYGVSIGIPEAFTRGEVNHLPIVILDKARRWDALQARKQKITGKAARSPVAAPGSRSATPRTPRLSREHEEARAKLATTHSPAEAEAVVKGILAKR